MGKTWRDGEEPTPEQEECLPRTRMGYRTQQKIHRQTKWLIAYAASGLDRKIATEVTGVSPSTVARWMYYDRGFQKRVDKLVPAIELELLEEAKRRALGGSDRLLEFLLEASNPHTFDKGVRRQNLANEAKKQIEGARTIRDLMKILAKDPFVDYDEVVKTEKGIVQEARKGLDYVSTVETPTFPSSPADEAKRLARLRDSSNGDGGKEGSGS